MEELVARYWNSHWGWLDPRDIWLVRERGIWTVRARQGDADLAAAAIAKTMSARP